jgi:hypothetical protein
MNFQYFRVISSGIFGIFMSIRNYKEFNSQSKKFALLSSIPLGGISFFWFYQTSWLAFTFCKYFFVNKFKFPSTEVANFFNNTNEYRYSVFYDAEIRRRTTEAYHQRNRERMGLKPNFRLGDENLY